MPRDVLGSLLPEYVKGFVAHGADPNVKRPLGFVSVEWYGSAEPVNAVDGDTWVAT